MAVLDEMSAGLSYDAVMGRDSKRFLLAGAIVMSLSSVASGCKSPAPPGPEAAMPSAAPHDSAAPSAASVSTPSERSGDEPCEGVPCETFPSAEKAIAKLAAKGPRVMAFGEAHAQRGGPLGPSTTKRFTDSLLPVLKGKATDLLIELWVANGSCGKKTEAKVATQQKAVSAPQAETNQNEFLTLGNASKAIGIRPHVLVPPCEDYAKILDAGAGDVDVMLSMIARLTANDIRAFLEKTEGKGSILLAYGGALHNDVVPKVGHESWSFGAEFSGKLGEKYMEVDLIVPEAIQDTPAWQGLAWYGKYKKGKQGDKAVLMTLGPSSYVVFFPPMPAPGTTGTTGATGAPTPSPLDGG